MKLHRIIHNDTYSHGLKFKTTLDKNVLDKWTQWLHQKLNWLQEIASSLCLPIVVTSIDHQAVNASLCRILLLFSNKNAFCDSHRISKFHDNIVNVSLNTLKPLTNCSFRISFLVKKNPTICAFWISIQKKNVHWSWVSGLKLLSATVEATYQIWNKLATVYLLWAQLLTFPKMPLSLFTCWSCPILQPFCHFECFTQTTWTPMITASLAIFNGLLLSSHDLERSFQIKTNCLNARMPE